MSAEEIPDQVINDLIDSDIRKERIRNHKTRPPAIIPGKDGKYLILISKAIVHRFKLNGSTYKRVEQKNMPALWYYLNPVSAIFIELSYQESIPFEKKFKAGLVK